VGIYADSGVITRGFGKNNRIVARGFGSSFQVGGVIPTWRHKEYEYDLFASILKKDFKTIKVFSPVNFIREKKIDIFLSIFKEVILDLSISSYINHEKLIKILDEI